MPRADLFAAGDPIAHPGQRHERPVAVAYRRHAVAQIDLRRLEHDLVLPRLVADERLVAIVLPAVEREMDVGVDEPGHDPPAARVDLLGAGGDRHRAARAHLRDARAFHDQHRIAQRRAAVAVDERRADDRDPRRRRLRGEWSERESDDCKDDQAAYGMPHSGQLYSDGWAARQCLARAWHVPGTDG